MRFLDDAAVRFPPSLLDIPVEVSGPRRGFRLLAADRELRSRSLRCFFGHRPTPWHCGFARRYISRPASLTRCANARGLLKVLREARRARLPPAILSTLAA